MEYSPDSARALLTVSIEAVTQLQHVADQYYAQVAEQLLFNDMSLVYGGLFDINANWTTPHQYHRLGTNCDINPYPLQNEALFGQYVVGQGGQWIVDCAVGCNYHTTF